MYKLGIDLGGTNIVAGVVDDNYNIIATGKLKTNAPRPAEEIVTIWLLRLRRRLKTPGLSFRI